MKIVSKQVFQEMKILGFIDETKNNKNFYVANKNKRSTAKTYFVNEDAYKDYLKHL